MRVFLLELEIKPKYAGSELVVVRDWHHFDVFSSVEKAVAAGKEILAWHLELIKEALQEDDCTVDEIANEDVKYTFQVEEFDTDTERADYSIGWSEHIEWNYNYKGELIDRFEMHYSFGYERLPGDEKEDAGTHFETGSFVTVIDEKRWDRDNAYYDKENGAVYVVAGQPGKRSSWKHPDAWENVYCLNYIDTWNCLTHTHIHERDLKLYEGEISEESPLWVLRKIALGELKVSEEMGQNIWEGTILLDDPTRQKSWRDIPELHAAVE